MPETDGFEKVAEHSPLSKWQREVMTPVEGGREPNTITEYRLESGPYVKVSKISDLGWSVRLKNHDEGYFLSPDDRFDNEEDAHDEAKVLVQQVME